MEGLENFQWKTGEKTYWAILPKSFYLYSEVLPNILQLAEVPYVYFH